MELNLKGRSALITGGSRGIGELIAKVLAQEGCDLTLVATDAGRLRKVADEIIAAHGVKVVTHSLDLSKLENIRHLADIAGDCDILVNNAGAIPRARSTTSIRRPGGAAGTSRCSATSISPATSCRA